MSEQEAFQVIEADIASDLLEIEQSNDNWDALSDYLEAI